MTNSSNCLLNISNKDIASKFILEDKVRMYFEIFDKFNLRGVIKFSNKIFTTNFNKLEIQINRRDFYTRLQNKVGFIPFIYNKRKIVIINND